MRSHLTVYRLPVLLLALLFCSGYAQDARETLGTKDGVKVKGTHPLTELMRVKNSTLKPELRGVHPRVYVTDDELATLRTRARTTHRELWQKALRNIRALKQDPPPAPAQERRAQNDVAIAIAEAALAYKIEGDQKYLAAAKKYMDAAVSYDVWGYTYNKPNIDLAAGHLLYGLGWGYDLLYNDLTQTERARYREKLTKQAQILFDYYKPKSGRSYSYSQNHVFIPMAGLAVTAYALYDETPHAPQWAALTRAIYDRVLATYSQDGYYYEGFEYWIFSTPWLIHYLDAQAHATGEDLYDQSGLRQMHKYVAHSMLPGGKYVFDFGDIFEGALTRARQGAEYPRTHPNGNFHTNYNLLYRLAQRFKNGEAQGVAAWLRNFQQVNAEDFWSLLWYEPTVKTIPIENQSRWYHFTDHDVVFWRSDWTPTATAFAFKCGPPEGHRANELLQQFSDWHLSSGHAHPDANSFIIFANGEYLTGDTGYAGVPMTAHHNTILINGKGQASEGDGHDAFANYHYERLNQIRIQEAKLSLDKVIIRGDATTAYTTGLGVKKFVRTFRFSSQSGFTIQDEIETEQPAIFTSLLHADQSIQQLSPQKFLFALPTAALSITIANPSANKAISEPNILTAPGRPGSVDKGEQQQRGQRLSIATTTPATSARFTVKLQAQKISNRQ